MMEINVDIKIPMKNITIGIPKFYDELISLLIKNKIYPSRSEAIRFALREFKRKLESEYKDLSILKKMMEGNITGVNIKSIND